MAVALHDHRILFVHIPKNAGSSISSWLINRGGQLVDAIRHSSLQDSIMDLTKFFSFCVVRNPWDRMISLYCYAQRVSNQNLSFDNWLKTNYNFKKHWYSISTPQVDWITSQPDLIMRYETLEKDFKYIQQKINSMEPLPTVNVSQRQHYSFYYSDWSRDFVANLYAQDIERFGYTFEN